MKTLMHVGAVGLLALGVAGCAEKSARDAVAAAEKEIEDHREAATKIAPDRLKALTDSLDAIKVRIDSGDYRSAVMSARSVTNLARDLGAGLDVNKQQLESAFKSAGEAIPALLDSVVAGVDAAAKARRLPPTIDAAKFATLRTESAGWAGEWKQANDDFAAGNLAQAMSKANQLRVKLRTAKAVLGLP